MTSIKSFPPHKPSNIRPKRSHFRPQTLPPQKPSHFCHKSSFYRPENPVISAPKAVISAQNYSLYFASIYIIKQKINMKRKHLWSQHECKTRVNSIAHRINLSDWVFGAEMIRRGSDLYGLDWEPEYAANNFGLEATSTKHLACLKLHPDFKQLLE